MYLKTTLIGLLLIACSAASAANEDGLRLVPPLEYLWAFDIGPFPDITLYLDRNGNYKRAYPDFYGAWAYRDPGQPLPSREGGWSANQLADDLCNSLNADVLSLDPDSLAPAGWPYFNTVCKRRTDGQIYVSGSYFGQIGVCPTTDPPVWLLICQHSSFCTDGTLALPHTWGRSACLMPETQPDPNKNAGPPGCNLAGGSNPINGGTGNKYEEAIDARLPGALPLEIVRAYNSDPWITRIGSGFWRLSYQRRLLVSNTPSGMVTAIRPTGRAEVFFPNGSVYASDPDIVAKLIPTTANGSITGWTYISPEDVIEAYDASGILLSIASRSGEIQTMSYSTASTPSTVAPTPGLLITVTDSYGKQLQLTYDGAARLASAQLPGGQTFAYHYDAAGRLASVSFPDSTSRTYLYNESALTNGANLPNALTGIIDENGVRYASFYYDTQGRAVRSEHAGGANRTSFTYSAVPQQTQITDANGMTRVFSLATVLGVVKNVGIDQPGAACDSPSRVSLYDANGNLSSRTDFNGNSTCSTFDLTRNLETGRVEGVLPDESCANVLNTLPSRPGIHKITTQWHPTWRRPTKVAKPRLLTTYVYNGDSGTYCAPSNATVNGNPIGVACSKTEQETNDATGQQGLAAPLVGSPRVWRYTYDSFGHVLTATDPNNRTTTTTYYPATDPDLGRRGMVATVTNPVGHVTSTTTYDGDGRVLSTTDSNGVVTANTYHVRGWLTSRTVGGETTSYEYDGVGQITRITRPDGSYVQLSHDAAHRLTQVQDGAGNRIVYTLDAMGNRIVEQAFDTSGQLSRVRQQVFDSFNLLHQTVGAQ